MSATPFFGLLFFIAVTLHFINDTWGTGDGLKWFWPISSKKYKVRALDQIRFSNQQKDFGHVTDDRWINDSYLQPTGIALLEYGTFLVALVALFVYFM